MSLASTKCTMQSTEIVGRQIVYLKLTLFLMLADKCTQYIHNETFRMWKKVKR